jgi:putative transposase
VAEASKKHKITKNTAYKYINLWKNEGIRGLVYNYGDGRPSKLSENEKIIVKSEIRSGNIFNVEDLVIFILKNFKIIYSNSWAYEFFKELSLEDGIRYPLSKEEKTNDYELKEDKNEVMFFINESGLKCLKVSEKLYFIRYEEVKKLKNLINNEKNHKMLKRYLFINGLNNNYSLENMVSILNISISTARKWLKLWNENGLIGLNIKWSEGRPSNLSDNQKQQVREYIKYNHVTRHSQVHKFILDNFNVDYSLKHIYRLLKKN